MSQITSSRAVFDRKEQHSWKGEGKYLSNGGSFPFAPAPERDPQRAAVRRSAARVQRLNQCTTCFTVRSASGACDC